MTAATEQQPMPNPTGTGDDVLEKLKALIADLSPALIADLESRVELGRRQYGERLRTFNDRNAATDCYQELLDALLYATQCYLEDGDERRPNNWATVVERTSNILEFVCRLIEVKKNEQR